MQLLCYTSQYNTCLRWFVDGLVSLNEHETKTILIEVDLATVEVNVASFMGGDGDIVPTTCQLIQGGELLTHTHTHRVEVEREGRELERRRGGWKGKGEQQKCMKQEIMRLICRVCQFQLKGSEPE